MAYILLLEDEIGFQQMLKAVLESADHVVKTAREGHEALAYLADSKFDLLIFDQYLPDMTGIECLHQVRALKVESPVILMTGVPEWHAVAEAIRLRAVDFLAKPFGIVEDFLPAVERSLQANPDFQ